MIRAAIITTSRADWNALGMVADAMRKVGGFDVQILEIGNAQFKAVKSDGWEPSRILPGYTEDAGQKAANIVGTTAELLKRSDRRCTVILGDRWDALSAALGASLAGVPIAHLSGGDVTTGSLDDRYRNAITALATYHFPTHAAAALRLGQMGVVSGLFQVGSPAIDRIKATPVLPMGQVVLEIGLAHCQNGYCVLNWQPETAANDPNAGLRAILGALESYTGGILCVGQNDDVGSPEAAALITAWAKPRTNVSVIPNLRPQLYLSALAHADFLIGSSSSGIYEAPALGCRVVNVGRRQNGRPLSTNIVSAEGEVQNVVTAINMVRAGMVAACASHLFGDGNAAPRIVEVLKSVLLA